MSSLEGLNSLIQLESTRLEGAKQTSQNFQSVGSVVQQQGTQTAQSRLNMSIQRIDAEYTKECALADVRRLERKLSRERASEALTKNIACIATISNAVGNLGHLFNDLNDRQKLGDTPDYLKSPPIDPNTAKVSITQAPPAQEGETRDHSSTVYLSGGNPDGSETVYSYDTGKNGVSVSGLPLAATITEYDKERILGSDYDEMKKNNNGNPLTFAEIHKKRPDLADKLVQTRGHGVSSSEAENLMNVANTAIKGDKSITSSPTKSQEQNEGIMNSSKMAEVLNITNGGVMSADQIAEISKIVGVSGMSTAQKEKIFGTQNPTEAQIKEKLSDPVDGKNRQTELLADPNFKIKISEVSNPAKYLTQKNENGNENVQYSANGINFQVNDISPSEKESILGKNNKHDFKNMSFSQIQAIKPNGQELARKLLAGVLEKDFGKLSADKATIDKLKTEFNYASLPKEKQDKIQKDYPELFKGNNFSGIDIVSLPKEKQDKIQKEHPELFSMPTKENIANFIAASPKEANEAITKLNSKTSRVKSLTPEEAKDNINKSELMKNITTSKQSLHDSLKQHGKIDDKGTWENIKDVGKKGLNFLVTTMDQSAPYFQAYLKAKERADSTYEELQAAIDKLNAASKKLRAMELQIDAFSGRGA